MEIYTQNLLGLTLEESRLQSNFSLIDATLKNINQQLANLTKNQKSMLKSVASNKASIETVLSKLSTHQVQINIHSRLIQNLNTEYSVDEANDARNQQKQSKLGLIDQNHHQIHDSKIKEEKKDGNLTFQDKKQRISQIKIQEANKKEAGSAPKTAGKNGLQRTFAALKDRLENLEKETTSFRVPIDEMNKILAKQRLRQQQHLKNKIVKQSSSQSKNTIKNAHSEQNRLYQGQILQGDMRKGSEKSMQANINQIFDLFAGKDVLAALQTNKLGVSDKEVSKQIQSLKQAIIEKIRSIQAQYSQNQNRINAIEKSVDVVQRSYEMFKYDFDRTISTGWSRQRASDTHEKGRRDKLNDTRVSNKENYEEKVGQIFQEMDKLGRECIDLQSRNQGEDVQIGSFLNKNNEQPLSKHSNYRLVGSLKNEGIQSKRQVAILKKDLNKLRLQFEEFALGINTNIGQTKTVVIKPNQTKQDWKALSTKIYKLKMQLQAGVRDLENKIVTNNDMVVVLNQLEIGIEECKLLIKRKVQQTDYEKGLKRVEARLNNFIMQVYEKQGKEQENQAALAKQPWFCLSCDTQLKNYTGKLLKSPTAQKLQGKKVNPESHMVRRYDNNRLPSVIK